MAEDLPTSANGHVVKIVAPARGTDLFSQVPEADALEQRRQVVDDSAPAMDRLRSPFDVNVADAIGQSQTVPMDEDDYR